MSNSNAYKNSITNEAFDRITAMLTKTCFAKFSYTRNVDLDWVKVTVWIEDDKNYELVAGHAEYVYGYCDGMLDAYMRMQQRMAVMQKSPLSR